MTGSLREPGPDDLLAVAVAAAREAGGLLLERFGRSPRGVAAKSTPTDLVSDADRDAQALVLRLLRDARPGDGVLAEEDATVESSTGVEWVVDPLDGTVNFLYGIPHWAVSVAARLHGRTVAGAVYDACRDEMYTAASGGGAHRNGAPLACSTRTDPSLSLVATGFSYDAAARARQARVAASLVGRVRDIRRAGTASLDLAWTACGRVDAFYEWGLSPWDVAAGELLVAEAGGRVSPLPGLETMKGVCASTAGVHDALLALVRDAVVN